MEQSISSGYGTSVVGWSDWSTAWPHRLAPGCDRTLVFTNLLMGEREREIEREREKRGGSGFAPPKCIIGSHYRLSATNWPTKTLKTYLESANDDNQSKLIPLDVLASNWSKLVQMVLPWLMWHFLHMYFPIKLSRGENRMDYLFVQRGSVTKWIIHIWIWTFSICTISKSEYSKPDI